MIPDRYLDFPEDLPGDIADRRAERICCLPCIEIKDPFEILWLKKRIRIITAPDGCRIRDAWDSRIKEDFPDTIFIIIREQAPIKDAEDPVRVTVPVVRCP